MTEKDIVAWLETNRPGSHWNVRSASWEGFEWLDDPATKPTQEEMGL